MHKDFNFNSYTKFIRGNEAMLRKPKVETTDFEVLTEEILDES